MLDAQTIATVKATIPLLVETGPKLTAHFYDRMFTHNPELKEIFNMSNQRNGDQREALFNAIAAYASNIENLPALLPAVEKIAQKHTSFQIKPEQYNIVGEHLLATLDEMFSPGQEVLDAWGKAYGVLANVFINREAEIYNENASKAGGWEGTRDFRIVAKTPRSALITSFELEPMGSYYYSTLSESLKQKAENAISSFDYYRTEAEYYDNARAVVAGEPNSDKLEVEYLDADGQIRFSSSDLTAFRSPGTPDIAEAISMKRTKVWIGADPSTGEHIMAASSPLMIDGEVVGVMRYVTSLNKVDKQIIIIVAIALGIGLGILGMVYFSNLYFIRSIVDPVAGITETAKRIAAGSYGVQIEKRYDDEIGALTDTINDMSLKINQSEKMKNEFISSVSHELRTPLTAINGWAETIMNGEVRDAGDVKKGMGIIVSEARRLTNMVEELLEFSRIQDGRFTLSVEPMDIKAELEDAVYTYREFFRREGIELNHFDCDEEFPPIAGDPERLRQVFCNLLDNAAKHGGSGKRIDTAIARDEDQVVITIRDYGPGIPAEELPHVKYKFYKGSSKARGSGIGLAVCDEIITRHEGTLDIDNAEGGGCIVTIHLPIRAQAVIEQKF